MRKNLCNRLDEYPINELSDGEKQAFFILADIALSAEPNSLVIADEPELNLNAMLASRLWDAIEGRLPEAIFVYATHNIAFALRPSVDSVVALRGHAEPAVQLDHVNDLDPSEARELLGALPAILAARAALAVEGEDQSFDRDFYGWIMGRTDWAVVPLGGCADVEGAVTRQGIWRALAPSIKLAGVVDRDFKSEESLDGFDPRCAVLEFHEAESFLCQPSVVIGVANALGIAANSPSENNVAEHIVSVFRSGYLKVAVNRTFSRAKVRLNVGLRAEDYAGKIDLPEIRLRIAAAARAEASKAEQFVGEGIVMAIFEQELSLCQKTLSAGSIEQVLRLCPGKSLINSVAPLAGCRDASMLARAVYKHLSPDSIESCNRLRAQLTNLLGAEPMAPPVA